MLQTSRFKLLGFTPGLHANPIHDERCPHPALSTDELECLAQCISAMDGVTPDEARRQIAEFRGCGAAGRTEATLASD